MTIRDLLNKDMGEVVEWLIDNQDKVEIVCKDEYESLTSNADAVADVLCNDGLCDLLREALSIVDGKGRAIPGGSYAVWKGDWQDLRDMIFKAYEIANQEGA